MKRIRQFYQEHEDACNLVAAAAGVVAVVVLASRMKRSGGDKWEKSRPKTVDLWQLDGGGASMIVVNTKDGLSHQFIREISDPTIAVG